MAPAATMETTAEAPLASQRPAAEKPMRRRRHVATKPQLLTRDRLDKRSNAAKLFDQLATDIATDLGGSDQLSTIERSLIEGFVGSAVVVHNLNTRLALGEAIDLAEHAAAVSAMVRVASRLGLQRRTKDVVPSLSEYLATKDAADADEPAA